MNIVAFEGIDGVGKTTQIGMLHNFLNSKDFNVVSIANPGISNKYSFAQQVHRAMQKDDHHVVSKAMLYAAIVIENQKCHKNKNYDYVLMDRFLYSTFAYNIFYPLVTNAAVFNADMVCNALIDLYISCDLHRNNTPKLFIMFETENPINEKYLPLDYQALFESYRMARPYMEKLYDKLGLKYLQITMDPNDGQDKLASEIRRLVWNNNL